MKMFDAGKTRMITLPYGEKTVTIGLPVWMVKMADAILT